MSTIGITNDFFLNLILLGLYWGDHKEEQNAILMKDILKAFKELDVITQDQLDLLLTGKETVRPYQIFLQKKMGFISGRGLQEDRFTLIIARSSRPITKWTPVLLSRLLDRKVIICSRGIEKIHECENYFENQNIKISKEAYLKSFDLITG